MGQLTRCPQCGSEEPGFFCRFCGTKLTRPDASGVEAPAGPFTQPLGLPPQPTDEADLPPTQATAAYPPDPPAYQPDPQSYQPAYPHEPWYPPDDGTGYTAPHGGAYPADASPAGDASYPPSSGASSKVLYGILGVLAACFVALGVWWATGQGNRSKEAVVAPTTPPATTGASTPSAAASTSASGPDAEQARASLAALQAARDGSRQQVALDGHWAAQLASKYDGIVDPLQTTAAGGHTFAYPDILTEYEQLRAAHGESVILLNGTDFGRQVKRPRPVFVTLYDGGFASSAQAQAWCAQTFPGVTGKALANKCVPRALRTPFG